MNNVLEDRYKEVKHTVKHDESTNISGKDAGALMFLLMSISGGISPILFIIPPQYESDETSCWLELKLRYEGFAMSDCIPMLGKF